MSDGIVNVAAGVMLRSDGMLLLGQRPVGKPWSGWWELPGGKLEPGESVAQALTRELKEEIDIDVQVQRPWVTYVHHYPEKTVRLAFQIVTQWAGSPRGMEAQQLQWVRVDQAHQVPNLLPATLPVLRWLSLPERYGITHIAHPDGVDNFLQRLDQALTAGLRLVQFREPLWPAGPADDALHRVLRRVTARCRAHGARLLVNSVHPHQWSDDADGIHLRAGDAAARQAACQPGSAIAERSRCTLLGVSAHSASEIACARALDADFVVVGPVLPTASHSEAPGLGWAGVTAMLADAGLPAFAIGGQSLATLPAAHAAGAHGVAGISAFI